ncbi:MAG: apolipoprotein N-acyltransferase [Bdellovibrionales bacterium]
MRKSLRLHTILNSLTYPAFADYLRAHKGWGRALAAFLFGAFSALAYAPIEFFPALWISFPALIFLLQGCVTKRAIFATAWTYAFGTFVAGLYWIAWAMLVDIKAYWWAVPLAVAGLPAFFALTYGLLCILAKTFWPGLRGVGGALTVALAWFLADYARGHMLTGFPWNLEGYAWTNTLPILQSVSLFGIYALTFLTLIAACLPASLAETNQKSRRVAQIANVAALAALAGLGIWGAYRLSQASLAYVPDARLRLVQPNIAQSLKWNRDTVEENFERLLQLSSAPAAKPITHIIWPETASTFYLAEDAPRRRLVASRLAPAALLTGVIRREPDGQGGRRFTNALVAVGPDAKLEAAYDKYHLVPFGEYIPLRQYVPLKAIASLGMDFSSGAGHQTLRIDGLPPFSPLICYEVIFSGEVLNRDDRPALLVNVTNDGWYGHTSGPYQHFAIARTRAVEEGLPLIRAANTGISGIVDPYGRVTARLGLGIEGTLDADLPKALTAPPYAHRGDFGLWIGVIGLLAGLALGHVKCKKPKNV